MSFRATALALLCASPLFIGTDLAAGCTFGLLSPVSFNAGANAGDLASGDFNHDGLVDVAVMNRFTATVNILLGTAGGGFGSATAVNLGEPTQNHIAAADLNGDGHIDLVVGINWQNNFTVPPHLKLLYGNGAGAFTVVDGPNVTINDPNRLVLEDFNHDGRVDVAVGRGSLSAAGFSIFLNTATGLGPETGYDLSTNLVYSPPTLVSGDFDHDGNRDLAFSDASHKQVHAFFGAANGTFGPAGGVTVPTNNTWYPNAMAAGDLNGDGNADLAIANRDDGTNSGALTILLSNGDRTFAPAVAYGTLNTASSIVVSDVDGDGVTDVVAGALGLEFFRGNGDGTFAPQIAFEAAAGTLDLAIADVDRDGGPDLIGTNFGGGKVVVIANTCARIRLGLTSSSNPANQGTDITITATATAPPSVAPTGTLTLSRGATPLSSVNLSTSMVTSGTLIDLAPGTYALTAHYDGDSRFAATTTSLQQVVQVPPFGPPPRLNAVSVGGPVALSWVATQGVDHYEIWRSSGGTFTLAGTSASAQFTDAAVAAGTAYLYQVRGVAPGGGFSAFGTADPTTTAVFSDETIIPGATTIKLAQLQQLRDAVNAVRNVIGLPSVVWAEAAPAIVRASHWMELRTAVDSMRNMAGLRSVAYSDPVLTPGATAVRAVHVLELRTAVR